MKSRLAVPAITSAPGVPRITLNQRAPATPVTARPTPRGSARTRSLRAIGYLRLGACLAAVSAARVRQPWGNWKDFLSVRFGLCAAGDHGIVPFRRREAESRVEEAPPVVEEEEIAPPPG